MKLEARESFQATEAIEWNDEALKAKVVLIRPGVNKSGTRDWKASALKKAVESHFWDGTKMFLDHVVPKNQLPSKAVNRSIKDMVAAVESTTLGKDGEVIGDVVFFDEKFYSFARRAQQHIGPSVNLLFEGDVKQRAGKRFEVVESLQHSKSVDWVTDPGAGGAILSFLGTEGVDDVEWDEVTLDMLKENRPDLVQALESAATPPPDDGKPPTGPASPASITAEMVAQMINTSIKEARESWDQEQSKKDHAQDQYAKKIDATGLPVLTRKRLLSAFEGRTEFDEKAVDSAIEGARAELAEAGVKPRVNGLGRSSTGTEGNGDGSQKLSDLPLHSALESAFGMAPAGEGDN